MIERWKYDEANAKLKGKLDKQIADRRERGDSYTDIAWWIATTTDVRVTGASVRLWYLRLVKT